MTNFYFYHPENEMSEIQNTQAHKQETSANLMFPTNEKPLILPYKTQEPKIKIIPKNVTVVVPIPCKFLVNHKSTIITITAAVLFS